MKRVSTTSAHADAGSRGCSAYSSTRTMTLPVLVAVMKCKAPGTAPPQRPLPLPAKASLIVGSVTPRCTMENWAYDKKIGPS